MTNTEIMKKELNNDLEMVELWRTKRAEAVTDDDIDYYRGCVMRSIYRAEAKAELIQSLGYTVLYNDEHNECVGIYPMELDD